VVAPIAGRIQTPVFDPTAPDACDSLPVQTRFYYLPLANALPNLTILGVNVNVGT
jgi:hypothetical protein